MRQLTPSDVHALLREHGLRPSRRLGQHFVADPNTARRIVRLAGVEAGDRVLEIGPGLGSLTLALVERGCSVLALELDRKLASVVAKIVGNVPRAVFVPTPKVDSALVELVRRDSPPVDVPSRARLFELVRAGFGHRRKMLRRSLRAELGERTEAVLTEATINPRARAESLGLAQWAALARAEAVT